MTYIKKNTKYRGSTAKQLVHTESVGQNGIMKHEL